MKTKEGAADKGQIKSEWIYENIDFPNYHLKYLKDFCPESLFLRGLIEMTSSAHGKPSLNMQKNLVKSSYI